LFVSRNYELDKYGSSFVRSFVRSLLRAEVQHTQDPSAETVERSNALAKKRGGELVGVHECVRDLYRMRRVK